MFPITKIPSDINNVFLRLIPENNKGIMRPDIDTTRTKRMTNKPVLEIVI
jgi:hypothetical protein